MGSSAEAVASFGDYRLRTPGRRDRVYSTPRAFAVFVTVDGNTVTGRTVAADGEEWDRFTLR